MNNISIFHILLNFFRKQQIYRRKIKNSNKKEIVVFPLTSLPHSNEHVFFSSQIHFEKLNRQNVAEHMNSNHLIGIIIMFSVIKS